MLTREKILETIRSNKQGFSNLGVVRIGLFGSYAKNQALPGSDVDILVELSRPDWSTLCAVWDTLEKQLNTKVDLIRKGSHLRETFIRSVENDIIYA
jgi:predicted nucleotidyltransferase